MTCSWQNNDMALNNHLGFYMLTNNLFNVSFQNFAGDKQN